jgi:hypothetical protein
MDNAILSGTYPNRSAAGRLGGGITLAYSTGRG